MGREYICENCGYRWTSHKTFGSPAICPSCKSNHIIAYHQTKEYKEERRMFRQIMLITIAVILLVSYLTISYVTRAPKPCDYKEMKVSSTSTIWQDSDGNNYTNPVETTNFISQGRCPAIGCSGGSPCSCKVAFIVKNNINKSVSFKINYLVKHNRIAGYGVASTEVYSESESITLSSNGEELLKNEYSKYCDDQECSVDQGSINIVFENLVKKEQPVYSEVCKTCNNKLCLNDRLKCRDDTECGSGNCNFLGFCD